MASLHRVSAVLCLAVGGTYAVEQGDPARTTAGGASAATNFARETVLPRQLQGPQHSEHWSKLDGLAADEGEQLGDVAFLAHPTECTAHCDAHAGCNSVTYCPTWGGCFLKDGIFTGHEATSSGSDCLTYYKIKDNEDWGQLGGLAADEGEQLGDVAFFAQPTECTAHCDAHTGCNSVTYCPKWGGCFLKDRVFTAGEATSSGSDCLTYYKIKDTTPAPAPMTPVKVPSSCAGYSPEVQGIDFSGTLLAKIQASDARRCCALCDSFAGCEGYVFHLDQCYLKKDLSHAIPKFGAVTRLRLARSAGAGASLRGSVIYP